MQYQATVNDKLPFMVQTANDGIYINDKLVAFDALTNNNRHLHLIINQQSVKVELLGFDQQEGFYKIKINGGLYQVTLESELQMLLKKLGLDKVSEQKINSIKAPMPGLVVRFLVKPGDNFVKGDGLVVLESMKMENMLKAPAAGTVDSILVKEGQAVEKNDVLIKVC